MTDMKHGRIDDAVHDAFLDHLTAGFDPCADCMGPAQLSIQHPGGKRIFDITVQGGLRFHPAESEHPDASQIVIAHDLALRLLKANEFLSPRDYDVRRSCWVDDRDPFAWAVLQAAMRPNAWAAEKLSGIARPRATILPDIETLLNPTISDVLHQISLRQPCKLRFDQMSRIHGSSSLADAAEVQYRFCADKEVRDRNKYLPDLVSPAALPQASYRMEQTAGLWSKFGIPFYGWNSFACLEVVAWDISLSRCDLYPVQSALTEFRLCASGRHDVALFADDSDAALTPFQGFGGLRYCRTPAQHGSATVSLEAGELLMITPGWYSQTTGRSPGCRSVSHYWRYA